MSCCEAGKKQIKGSIISDAAVINNFPPPPPSSSTKGLDTIIIILCRKNLHGTLTQISFF
jgi:hypothetical protein